MQYNNIANMRVPQSIKKGPMASSQFFPSNKPSINDFQYGNKKQHFIRQKNQFRQGVNVPSFLQLRKPEGISQSVIFNSNNNQTQNSFNNPFMPARLMRGSVQQTKKPKDSLPSFLKNQDRSLKQQSVGKSGFYKKFKSPEPNKGKQSLFSSAPINKESFVNRSRADSRTDSNNQAFSPIHPKKLANTYVQKGDLNLLNKKILQKQKQKNDSKEDQKSTMSISQKSTKIPEFLKKNSPQNANHKQLSNQQVGRPQKLFNLQKINSQSYTQPLFQMQKRNFLNQNRQQIQSNFSKKKQNDITSASFAKISNTPQSIPVKPEFPNFQFGRLSSPSALNNRKRIDSHSVQKQFTIQDFQLVDKIGKGAFGDVYMARQKLTGFLCVLKKVSKKKIRQLKLEQNILREIKIQAFLRHKHLTSLYGFFADEEYLFLILQILPDGSMSQVKKKKRVPQNQVSKFVRQVCQGLRYMHKEQIIHRDLKPQNIFLNEDYIKIGDFGCAVYTQTLRKTIVGCLAYISPEQLNNDFYDDKIDAWSVGILTYELITGKAPFEQEIAKISKQQIEPNWTKINFPEQIQISQTCKDFILKLLQLNPTNRMSIDECMRHSFITKILEQQRRQQQEIFGQYQGL